MQSHDVAAYAMWVMAFCVAGVLGIIAWIFL